jgi:hypothetical protein
MQVRQALVYRRGDFSLALAVAATLVAAAFGIALVIGVRPAVVSQGGSTFAQHQQAPDAAERNAQFLAAQAGGPQSDLTRALPTAVAPLNGSDSNQSPDAKDRNAALSQGK